MSPGASNNLILTGFMGTGKTAVGQGVAVRLGRTFVDMDVLLEGRAGQSIADVFAQHSESHFRRLEAALCRELAAEQELVIATGGWALGPAENRKTMTQTGLIICLTATTCELIRRLEKQTDRPLLMRDDWRAHLEQLLVQRQPAYRQIALQLDTTLLSSEGVADRVLGLWDAFQETGAPRVAPVSAPGGGYQVLVGHGLLDRLGVLMEALPPLAPPLSPPQAGGIEGGPTVIVTDENVAPLYGNRAIAALGPSTHLVTMPAGEEHKTLDTLRGLYDQLLAAGLDRSGTVVALGGGVVGDVAGFAAATFMRGVRFIQVPTTLLAMVDSSVGAKTGVDLPQGKNLVGAFKQPALVVADPDTLSTLPPVEVQCGLAEMVKHGIIGDQELFEELDNSGLAQDSSFVHLITQAIQVKQDVVQEDPFEQGRRATLNLGHTFGHALEKCSGFQLKHGQAVAIGMVAAARTAVKLGLCEAGLAARVETALDKLGLPTRYRGMEPEAVWAAMATDKKKQGRRLRFILPKTIGRVIITDQVSQDLVLEVLAELREDSPEKRVNFNAETQRRRDS